MQIDGKSWVSDRHHPNRACLGRFEIVRGRRSLNRLRLSNADGFERRLTTVRAGYPYSNRPIVRFRVCGRQVGSLPGFQPISGLPVIHPERQLGHARMLKPVSAHEVIAVFQSPQCCVSGLQQSDKRLVKRRTFALQINFVVSSEYSGDLPDSSALHGSSDPRT